ncbi:MAG: hypothetical protein KA536_05390 [Saprospiraceae bacterium]|nr:hypothetical protein [Saprospiraceae bacterium]
MKVKELLELDLKKSPLIIVDDSLEKYEDDSIPQFKIDSVNDSVKNTNLLKILKDRNITEKSQNHKNLE